MDFHFFIDNFTLLQEMLIILLPLESLITDLSNGIKRFRDYKPIYQVIEQSAEVITTQMYALSQQTQVFSTFLLRCY